jgi:cytochrome c551/c552
MSRSFFVSALKFARVSSIFLALGVLNTTAGVLKIDLPHETESFKPAPGVEMANGQCLVCHSVEYVATQPPMPRTFWVSSVKKMRDKYAAQIPEEQIEPLADYLSRTYGTETNATPSPASAHVIAAVKNEGGEALVNKYFCLTCHAPDKKIGPPYKDVAQKYSADPAAVDKITEQIAKGGSGKWGSVLMPPFPMISAAESKAIAAWILNQK